MEDLYSELSSSRRGNEFKCSFLVEQEMIAAVKAWLDLCGDPPLSEAFVLALGAEETKLGRKGQAHHTLRVTPRLLLQLVLAARSDHALPKQLTEQSIRLGQIRARIETWALAWMLLRDTRN